MLKKLLLSSILISSISNAGVISGHMEFNYQFGDLNPSGITFDTPLFDREDAYFNALSLFPSEFNFHVYLDDGPQSGRQLDGLFSLTNPQENKPSESSREASFTFDDNSFSASFFSIGYECLQGTGILVQKENPYNDNDLGLESECYSTLSYVNFTFGELSTSSYTSLFPTIKGRNSVTSSVADASISINKSYYNVDKIYPGEFDDLTGFSHGSSSVSYTASANDNLYITYVPETNALALFGLGLLGFGLRKRKNK